MNSYIKCEFKKMFKRNEWLYALAIGILFAVFGLMAKTNDAYKNVFNLLSTIESPTQSAMTHTAGVIDLLVCLLPMLVSLPCAWFYHEEMSNHSISVLLTRGTLKQYLFSKAIVISLSGFVLAVLPLVANLCLCLLAYPFPAHGIFAESAYSNGMGISQTTVIGSAMFPTLYMNSPVLDALIHIALFGLFGSVAGLLTFAITLYFRKHIIVTLGLTTVAGVMIILVLGIFGAGRYMPQSIVYTDPNTLVASLPVFVTEMLLILCAVMLMLAIKLRRHRDVLP